jgi:hypothetical protein
MKIDIELRIIYINYLSKINPEYAHEYNEYSDFGILYLVSQNYVGGLNQLKADMAGLYLGGK